MKCKRISRDPCSLHQIRTSFQRFPAATMGKLESGQCACCFKHGVCVSIQTFLYFTDVAWCTLLEMQASQYGNRHCSTHVTQKCRGACSTALCRSSLVHLQKKSNEIEHVTRRYKSTSMMLLRFTRDNIFLITNKKVDAHYDSSTANYTSLISHSLICLPFPLSVGSAEHGSLIVMTSSTLGHPVADSTTLKFASWVGVHSKCTPQDIE